MKSEKEKMLSGELYNASDKNLTEERIKARELLHELNNFDNHLVYKDILKALLPNAASDIHIEPPFYCDYGYNIYCDKNVFFNFNCVLLDVMPIRIGSNVLFGPNVQIYTASHPINALERRKGLEYSKPISIGNDCWIGGSAVLFPGVTIGDRCVIGAGSIVTKNIPNDTIAAGNPARSINR